MNRKTVEQNLNIAYKAITEYEIADENGKVNSTFRSYISQFGVSVVQGSVLAALSFYKSKEEKLVNAILYILSNGVFKRKEVYKTINESNILKLGDQIDKEDVINASIALKLALNLFEIDKQ